MTHQPFQMHQDSHACLFANTMALQL